MLRETELKGSGRSDATFTTEHEMSWISLNVQDDAAEQQEDTSNVDKGMSNEEEESREGGEKEDEESRQTGHDIISAAQRPTHTEQPEEYYGLRNQGATCYLNSVLQVLFMTPELHGRLDQELEADIQLKNIFEGLKRSTCGTEAITTTFGITNVYQQCDAAECLEWILKTVSPRASEVFQGELTYETTCGPARHLIRDEKMSFWTLPLPLTDTPDSVDTFEEGFESIWKSKSFRGDDAVYCSECGEKTEGTRRCEGMKTPQILMLLLKRFVLDYSTWTHVKTDCPVHVLPAFELIDTPYELYAMVNHTGCLRFGHYTATILSAGDKTWYEFDDTRVRKADRQPFAGNEPYISRTAYLLMYRASQMPPQAESEDLLDEAKNQQDETSDVNQVTPDEEEEESREGGEKEDEESRQTGHSAAGEETELQGSGRSDATFTTEHEKSWISLNVQDDAAEQQEDTSNVDKVMSNEEEESREGGEKEDEESRQTGHNIISAAQRPTHTEQPASQMPPQAESEDLPDEPKNQQDETRKEVKEDEVEQKINMPDTDDEEQKPTAPQAHVMVTVEPEAARESVAQSLIKRKDRESDLQESTQDLDKETKDKKQRTKRGKLWMFSTNEKCLLFCLIFIFAFIVLACHATLTAITWGPLI